MQYESRFTVKECHLDTMGHMNNAQYLIAFEQARWDWATSVGMGFDKIRSIGIGFVVLELKIRFSRELRLREEVVIKTDFQTYNRKIGEIKQEMNSLRGELCCRADIKVGLMDLKKRELIPPTDEFIAAFNLEKLRQPIEKS